MLTKILCSLLFFFLLINSLSAYQKEDKIESTEYFDFYSNYWINLYHYLYITASVGKNQTYNERIDANAWEKLSKNEKELFTNTLEYFNKSIIQHDLRISSLLYNLKRKVIHFNQDDKLVIPELPDSLINSLNNFKDIYDKYFWEKHDRINRETLSNNLELIKKYEKQFVAELKNYTKADWQTENIRVDISYFSKQNRGRNTAYTTVRPEAHVSISSQINEPFGNWFEVLFHEASHHLIHGNEGFIGSQIIRAAKELYIAPPRDLWHAVLFYISGRVSQNFLKAKGISYELYMVRNKVFDYYYPYLEKFIEPYLNDESDFKSCVKNLLTVYHKKN